MDWPALIRRLTARGWVQMQIAERVGARQPTISELLNGVVREPRHSLGAALIELDESGEGPPTTADAASH